MVDLLRVNRVQYVWNEETGERKPLCYLYFCKYCLDVKSEENLQHEVDSHFCPQSMDGVTTTESVLKRNKSANSWQCPACPHTLTTRATTMLSPDPNDSSKQIAKKTYYQACSFCRWTSREVGIPDMLSASGGWAEREVPNLARINEVIEYYKYIAQKEFHESKTAKRRGYKSLTMQLQQKYGSPKSGRKPHPASPMLAVAARLKDPELKQVKIEPSMTVTLDDLAPLPEDIYSRQIDFTKISSIDKRLNQPEHQIAEVENYIPKRATMMIKRSLRCKKCEHNLIKPEYIPTSIKFKMELVAIRYVPEIQIHKQPELKPGVRTRVTLVGVNRTDHASNITLIPLVAENVNYSIATSKCELPPCTMTISRYQDADFGNVDDMKRSEEASEVIAFRDANRLGFYVWVTPNPDLEEDDEVWISFSMKYDHFTTIALLLQQKPGEAPPEPEVNWLCHRVFVNLGKI